MKRIRIGLTAAVWSAVFAVPVAAHDTWIVSGTPAIKAGGSAVLHVTSGVSFPKYEYAPEPLRLARAEWRVGENRGNITSFEKGDSTLMMRGRALNEGTAVVCVEFHPNDIDLEPEEVEHYLEEIGAPESVRRAWEEAGPGARFHETYTKRAKTYVRVGDGGSDPSCLEPTGFAIDFLPDRDPTSVKPGDTLAIRVVKGGDDEMEGLAVGAVCGADGRAMLQRTNQNGVVLVPIHAAGWWLIRTTELRRQVDGSWQSDFTTMTFYAGAK
jgi:uncharacterized GH25 family protein